MKIVEFLSCLHEASVMAGERLNLSYIEEEDVVVIIDCDLNHYELNVTGKTYSEVFRDVIIAIGKIL